MQKMSVEKKIWDVGELQEHIIEEWEWLNQSVIDSAITQWRAVI